MPDTPPRPDPTPGGPRPTRRWAEQELGELLARAWLDGDAASPAAAGTVEATPLAPDRWEVTPLPTAAEGGVVAMLLGSPQPNAVATQPNAVATRPNAPANPADAPAAQGDAPVKATDGGRAGRALLQEMLRGLPTEPPLRLTPDDVDVDVPDPAPPAVWFWGDDDIYPDRVPGASEGRGQRGHPRRRRGPA